MTGYILTALRFDQILDVDEKGNATKRIRHRRGALITDLDELEARRLLKAGAIVPASEVGTDDDESDGDSDAGTGDADDANHAAGGSDASTAPTATGGADPERPRPAASMKLWAAYAEARGIPAEKVAAMANKDAIIAAVDELDTQ
ncbi:lipase chaperone [Rhodococcus hoagii]|nr:lipase chaperone [Prescottella equi]NKZ71842.1 lipase chaperone [Prescottella equi]